MLDLALDVFFSNVTMLYHDNNLLIPDWRVIYDYLCSLPGIEKVMRKNKEASVKFLKDRVTESKPFFIRRARECLLQKRILKVEVNDNEWNIESIKAIAKEIEYT